MKMKGCLMVVFDCVLRYMIVWLLELLLVDFDVIFDSFDE